MLSFGFIQGLYAAGIFSIATMLFRFIPKAKQYWAAALLLILITPLALGGIWFSLPAWGVSDWDYYFSLHHSWRQNILTHHQFPFWNPVTCGGTAGLGEPEFSVLTPTFLLELIFGIPVGLRLAIFFSVALTGLGAIALAKQLKLSPLAALTAALILSFGSVNLLEIVEGHVNIFAAMWIPWIFWAWIKVYRKELPAFVCGIFLALTFLQGGIYLLMYTALAFLVLPLLTKKPLYAYKVCLIAGVWALGFAAVKLIPVFLWLRQFQDAAYAGATYTLPYIHKILFGRYLHGSEVLPNQGTGWHEYGAYIGITASVLASLGFVIYFRTNRIVRGLCIAAVLALLLSSAGPLLKPAFDHMPWFPRSAISRVILFTIIPVSLLAGFGIDALKKIKFGYILAFIFISISAVELLTFSYQLSEQPFVLPTVVPAVNPAPSPLAFTAHKYTYRTSGGVDYDRTYAAVLAGYGSMNYCSTIGPEPMVRTIHDEEDTGIVSLNEKAGTVEHVDWSPNQITVTGNVTTPTTLILNTNFAKGWFANQQKAVNRSGRVSTDLSTGPFTVVFTYVTPGYLLGLIITLLTIATALYSKVRKLWA